MPEVACSTGLFGADLTYSQKALCTVRSPTRPLEVSASRGAQARRLRRSHNRRRSASIPTHRPHRFVAEL